MTLVTTPRAIAFPRRRHRGLVGHRGTTALPLAAARRHVYAGVRRPGDAPKLPAAAQGEITPLLLDVTDPAEIEAAAHKVAGHTGRAGLDGLMNNAGIGVFGPLEIIPIEQFRRQMEINLTGQLAMTQTFLPLLRLARGRVTLIGSIGTRFTPPFAGRSWRLSECLINGRAGPGGRP
jgi:NAD(P)-dependent dehydrogenase (short-subunit alcohol dehydrogenase family)